MHGKPASTSHSLEACIHQPALDGLVLPTCQAHAHVISASCMCSLVWAPSPTVHLAIA